MFESINNLFLFILNAQYSFNIYCQWRQILIQSSGTDIDDKNETIHSDYEVHYYYEVHYEFTIQINSGENEFCSFVDLKKGDKITIGYWVG